MGARSGAARPPEREVSPVAREKPPKWQRGRSGTSVALRVLVAPFRPVDCANENDPTFVPLLSFREREVLSRVALGQSNKTIAAALHISAPAVATYLARGRRKLGGGHAKLFVRRLRLVTLDPSRMQSFTPAEHAVAVLAAEGFSNKTIAELRRCSAHTVANQLSSVYAKLGGLNRRALKACLLEIPVSPEPQSSVAR